MAWLVQHGIVHRDLAARNVVLGEGEICKITDFGLACFAQETDLYRQDAAMPIKWLAPECCDHLEFTEATDVWAFGVLLWEMAAKGRSPPLITPSEFKLGFRLERVDGCKTVAI